MVLQAGHYKAIALTALQHAVALFPQPQRAYPLKPLFYRSAGMQAGSVQMPVRLNAVETQDSSGYRGNLHPQ